METTNNNAQAQITEITTLLHIPNCVVGSAFAKLENKSIKADYVGMDESGRVILKVAYSEWQKQSLERIINELETDAKAFILALDILGQIAANYGQYKSQ